jgi:hypothetical protein
VAIDRVSVRAWKLAAARGTVVSVTEGEGRSMSALVFVQWGSAHVVALHGSAASRRMAVAVEAVTMKVESHERANGS